MRGNTHTQADGGDDSLDDEVELGAGQHDDAQEGGQCAVHHRGEGVLGRHHHSTVPRANGRHESLWSHKQESKFSPVVSLTGTSGYLTNPRLMSQCNALVTFLGIS